MSKKQSHNKAYEYLERVEEAHSKGNEVSTIYERVKPLIKTVGMAADFGAGVARAVEQYKSMKDDVESNEMRDFMLVQFLEELYERYSMFHKYYTEDIHERNFTQALSLAYEATDNKVLLGDIYSEYGIFHNGNDQ